MIDIHHLGKTYREGIFGGKKFRALDDVTLQIQPGEVFGLLGPNGAGKTTMIKILLGILHASDGNASVLGLPAGSRAARRRIGYLPENLTFPRHHTGRGALYFYARLNEVPERTIRQREEELFQTVGLLGRQNEPVRKYSKGMRQRLGLAQAMMHDPEILIMDEPTDGLDPVGRSEIRRVIDGLKARGKTVFLNSHILQEVELVCDRVAILAKGKLRRIGTPLELKNTFNNQLALKVQVELDGSKETISQALDSFPHELLQTSADTSEAGMAAYMVQVKNQPELNQLVDKLRQANISILRIDPLRPRLEDVFMQVVESSGSVAGEHS